MWSGDQLLLPVSQGNLNLILCQEHWEGFGAGVCTSFTRKAPWPLNSKMHRHLLNVVEQILLKEECLQLEQDTLHTVSTAPAFVSWGAVPQRYFPQNLSSTCRSLHKSKRLILLLQFFHQNVHSILNVSNHMNSMDHPHWLTMHNICKKNLTGLHTNLHVIEDYTNQNCISWEVYKSKMFMLLLQFLHQFVRSSLQRYEQRGSAPVDNHHALYL